MTDLLDAGCIVDENHPFVLTKDNARELTHCQFRGGGQIILYYGEEPVDEELQNTSSQKTASPAAVSQSLPAAEVPATNAFTEAPAAPTAANEINSIMQQAGGANGSAVVLAIIAVAGGGAGWKFYQSFAKQKHEEKMKELEIQQQKLEKTDHHACAAQHAALATKIEELTQKLASVEQKSLEISGSGPGSELEKRLKKLENAAKRKKT